jgi:hypothetical protein
VYPEEILRLNPFEVASQVASRLHQSHLIPIEKAAESQFFCGYVSDPMTVLFSKLSHSSVPFGLTRVIV